MRWGRLQRGEIGLRGERSLDSIQSLFQECGALGQGEGPITWSSASPQSCFSGEGFHNYHHTFPYDYSTSEFGWRFNLTTAFIDLMCFLGLASDRKKVSKEVILARKMRTGDGSHKSG